MKKILILMLAVVLATAMLVSCSDDSAYTEVLESDGAFSYNGKSYGSLEEVIAAINGSKAVNYDATTEFDHTITLTRDVVTRSAKIAVDGSIVLNLNGYTMQLEDTSDAAITVSNGTFCIKNGTVKMNDSSSTAALIKANNEARVEFQGDANIVGNIVVDDKASVYSYDKAVFEGDVTLDGNASFSTYSSGNTTISTLTLPAGTSLNVGTTATVNGVDGDIEGDITAAEGAEITSDDESLDTELNGKIVEGVYYVESGSGKIYYASIAKAIEQGETKITQQYDDENSNNNLPADIEIVTSKTLTIDSITLSSGKTITLSGDGTVSTVNGSADGTVAITGTTTVSEITGSKATVKVTGTKTAMPTIGNVDAAIFTAEYANINGDVETTGTQSYTNVVFGVEANEASDTAAIVPALTSTATNDAITIADSTGTVSSVIAESSSVTITDSRVSGNTLTTGTLTAKTVSVTGNEKVMPSIGGVDATSVEATYATITGNVSTTGTQSYNNVVFAEVENVAPNLTSTVVDAVIVLTDSTGTVGAVTAESSSVTITDSRVSGNILTTGTLTAKTVSVTGNEKVMPSIGGVYATSVEATYATIAGNVSTAGTQSYNNVVFVEVENVAPNLTSTVAKLENVDAAIVITDSTGSLGTIKAEAFAANEDSNIISILIGNSSVKANLAIEALDASTDEEIDTYGDIAITGTVKYPVSVGSVKANDLTANFATFNGAIEAVDIVSTSSTFNGAIEAADIVSTSSTFTGEVNAVTVTDGVSGSGSTFSGDVNTTGTQSYNGSVFVDEPKLTSTATELEEGSEAAIVITNATGKVGSIKTEAFTYSDNGFYSIIINNSEATASLTTGMLSAYTSTTSNDDDNNNVDVDSNIYGDISVTGKSSNSADVIVIGSRSNNFTVKYAQVSGEVFASSKLTSSYSLFRNAYVDASVIYDGDKDDSASGSTLDDSTFYPGQIYLYYTEFLNASNIESDGSVYMVNVLGVAGSIESDSSDISIINEEATSLFTVGTINSDHNDIRGNVSVSGNASYLPVIGDVKADSMMAEYAKITGTVDTYGNQSYLRTAFSGASKLNSKGAVYLEDVKGVVAKVEATTITIDNTKAVADFTTGTLSATEDITVTGNTSYKPTITHVDKAADLKVEYAKVVGDVSTSGTQIYTNVEFVKKDDHAPALVSSATDIGDDDAAIVIESSYGTVGDITANGTVENTETLAEGSSIKIDASGIEDLLSTGKLSAKTVEVVGNADYMPSIGGVDSEDKFEASYVTITGDVTTDGIQKYTNVVFSNEYSEAPNLVSNVTTIGSYDEAAIYISESVGDIGDITATHSIKIETSEELNEKLTTGELSAQTVTVIGNSNVKPSIGGVDVTTDFVVNDAIIAGDVTTSGIQEYTNVVFLGEPALESTITESARDKATEAAIYINNSIGTVGNITASYSSIEIDASSIKTLLSTGKLSAPTVTIKGNSSYKPAIGGLSELTNFVVSDVTITGNVETFGIQKYTNVEFENSPSLVSSATEIGIDDAAAIVIESSYGTVGNITANGTVDNTETLAKGSSIKISANGIEKKLITGTLSAKTVTVVGNTSKMPTIGGVECVDDFTVSDVIIAGNVTTKGIQKYTNVEFEAAPDLSTDIDDSERIKAAGAAIYIDNSIGTVGDITAEESSILIDASQIKTLLKTGTLTAKTVTINGNPEVMPSIGGLSGLINFVVSDVTITGDVTTDGIQKYTNVEFAKGEGNSEAPKLISNATAIGVDDKAAIVIESSYGTVGAVTAESSTITITDSRKSGNILTTGKLTAKTVTVTGNEKVMPSIGGVETTTLVAEYATIIGDVTTDGTQKYTNVVFSNEYSEAPKLDSNATEIGIDDDAAIVIESSTGIVGDITATHSIKIDADGITKNLKTGKLSAHNVTVNGYSAKMPTIGGVECVDDFAVSNVIIAGNVETFGLQQYTNVVFEGAPALNTTISDSEFTKAADAAIHIVNSIGTVGNITAFNSSILVDASGVSEKLWIGTLTANKKVTVKGNPKIRPSIGDVEATEFVVNATDFVVNDAIIAGDVTTSGIQEYTNVVFKGSPELISAIADDNLPRGVLEAINISNSTGAVGYITAAESSIKIDNSDANEVLATGTLTAKTVTVTGNEKIMPSIGDVYATSVEARYATIAGDVTTTGTQSYTNVKFEESDDDGGLNLESSANSLGTDETAIYISNSTGTVGYITAAESSIKIDNRKAKATLGIGRIYRANTVEVTGNSSAMVSIEEVLNVSSLNTAYVTIGTISADVCAVTSRNSVFNGGITAKSIEDGVSGTAGTGSKFNGTITTTDAQSYYYSEFAQEDEYRLSSENLITLSNVSGTIYAISTDGNSLVVDQTKAEANLNIIRIDTTSSSTNGDVTITSASTEDITTTIGSIKGGNITLNDSLALNGSKSATLIVVTDITAYGTLNVYGGKYGNTEDGIDISYGSGDNDTLNVYMGTFYVDDEPNFQKVAENLRYYNVNSYYGFVEILLNKNITLASEVQFGGWESTTDKYIGNKSVLIAGSDDVKRITIPYYLDEDDDDSCNFSLNFHSGSYKLSDLTLVGSKTDTKTYITNYDFYHYTVDDVFVSIVVKTSNNAELNYSTETFSYGGKIVTL